MKFPRMLPLVAVGVFAMNVAEAIPIDIFVTATALVVSRNPGDVFGATQGSTVPLTVTFSTDTDLGTLVPAGTDFGDGKFAVDRHFFGAGSLTNAAAFLGGAALPQPFVTRVSTVYDYPVELILFGDLAAPSGAAFGFQMGADGSIGSLDLGGFMYPAPDQGTSHGLGEVDDYLNGTYAEVSGAMVTSVLHTESVPEPSSMMLILFALAALFVRRCWRAGSSTACSLTRS
jgi:hypothetical protein